ncbi:class I SAM-dependent methyltransferase [Streptomyces sp. A7024]|uniref:Class I SAM-dependent methyltransferase n=1 Tax=Streptomyces coryli TaxID=1128680 RepID=A0A6G4TSG6_9ACTN|nr:class I SAM-dependent methyltransferase [Streptomyces coryli]
MEGWEWDETLFAGTAAYYERGRLPYAPGLADAIAGALRPDRRGRLLDVGCGPGIVALTLAHLFDEVVGVDPDHGMITEAEQRAAKEGVAGKTAWLQLRAEELPAGLGAIDAAVFAQSFHWMDQPRVAATVRDMLRPGGVLLHVSDQKDDPGGPAGPPHPPVPQPEIDALVRSWLGPVRRAGRGSLPQGTPGGEEAVFAAAGFTGPQHLAIPGGQPLERTIDDIVASVFSMSFAAPHLFGDRLPDFETELRELLRTASPEGRFSVRQPGAEVYVWGR